LKIVSDGADVVSSGSVFQTDRGPATQKTLLPTVESLTGGTRRLLELAERSVRRPGWSTRRTRSSRYHGADHCSTLYITLSRCDCFHSAVSSKLQLACPHKRHLRSTSCQKWQQRK